MTYEMSAAETSPQTAPLMMGIRVDTRGGMKSIAAGTPRANRTLIKTVKMGQMTEETGKRPNGASAAILAASPPRIDVNAKRRRVSAAVLPPPILRTSLFARLSRGFTTQTAFFNLLATQVIGA